jgi:hypothetical protein
LIVGQEPTRNSVYGLWIKLAKCEALQRVKRVWHLSLKSGHPIGIRSELDAWTRLDEGCS